MSSRAKSRDLPLQRFLPLRLKRWCARHRNLFDVVPILVYQMAKVGSRAVFAAIERAKLPVFHIHRMDARHLAEMRENRRELGWYIPRVPGHDRLGLRLRREVIDRGSRVAIITLVRDPIARNLSSYFEHLDYVWDAHDAHKYISLHALIQGFHERYTHEEPLTWFDDEMRPVTGIDVYEHPFPRSGSLQISAPPIELLILKSELPDEEKTTAISKFLGTTIPNVMPENRTSGKSKGALYAKFLKRLRLDREYVERMLDSRYARHFYSDDEREIFRRKYTV